MLRVQRQIAQHVAYLILQVLTYDQEHLETTPPGQFPIAREKYPPFRSGDAHQLVIAQTRLIESIVAKDTQPLGQRA